MLPIILFGVIVAAWIPLVVVQHRLIDELRNGDAEYYRTAGKPTLWALYTDLAANVRWTWFLLTGGYHRRSGTPERLLRLFDIARVLAWIQTGAIVGFVGLLLFRMAFPDSPAAP